MQRDGAAAWDRGEATVPRPAAIEDLNETADIRATFRSHLYGDHVPAQDEAVVARMRRRGVIVLGKTDAPEFGRHGYGADRRWLGLGHEHP